MKKAIALKLLKSKAARKVAIKALQNKKVRKIVVTQAKRRVLGKIARGGTAAPCYFPARLGPAAYACRHFSMPSPSGRRLVRKSSRSAAIGVEPYRVP
jgi:hypothetical protein